MIRSPVKSIIRADTRSIIANAGGIPPPPVPVPATFNPSDISPNYTLFNGNLSMFCAVGGWNAGRSFFGKTSGKHAFEVTDFNSSTTIVGIGSSLATLSYFTGSNVYSVGYYVANNSFGYDAVFQGSGLPSFASPATFELDIDNKTFQIRRQSGIQSNLFDITSLVSQMGVSGLFIMVSIYSAGDYITLNTGQAPFTTPAQAGFPQGWFQ